MQELYALIEGNEIFLLKRTLDYAKLHNYVKYTSTLEEAWQVSINGLSEALLQALETYKGVLELDVDENYSLDRISSFGIIEAQRHRSRGVTLEMFLGLMKYYRQSYLDLIMEANLEKGVEHRFMLFINRFFDRVELGFCSEWAAESKEVLWSELQNNNREITNEKNKYLTIFESIPTPVIILDSDNMIDNMNKAALNFVKSTGLSGTSYYSNNRGIYDIAQILPWLLEEANYFIGGIELEATINKVLELPCMEAREIAIKFNRMLDVSEKYKGTVIIFSDLTERKQIEDKLRYISFHDDLTGLYNRAFFQEELFRLGTGRFDPVALIECDVDGLKVINDTLGHPAGDLLLITAAALIRQSFRDSDIVARIGGDEFAVSLPSSSPEALEAACERIRMAVANHNRQYPLIPLSISIGAAIGDTRIESSGQIFKKADREMYKEKPVNRERFRSLFNSLYAQYGENLFKV